MSEHDLIISPSGRVRFIYSDDLQPLIADLGGEATGGRASRVEPDSAWRWWVDMTPVGGGQLGPFDTREEALAAEVEWLRAHDLPVPEVK